MTDISKSLREILKERTEIRLPKIVEDFASSDGSHKWIIEVESGSKVEMVFIPESGRGTLCISSQAGCSLDCSFCATGKQGFNIYGIDVANKSRLLEIPEVADLLEEVKTSDNLNYMIFQGDNYDKPAIWIGEKSKSSSLSTEDLKQALFEA